MPNYKSVLVLKKKCFKQRLRRTNVLQYLKSSSCTESINTNFKNINNEQSMTFSGQNLEADINNLTTCDKVLITIEDQPGASSTPDNFDTNEDDSEIDDFDEEADEAIVELSNQEIKNFLAIWALRNKIPHVALNELLVFLKNNTFEFLPIDSRTLLQTPRFKSIEKLEPGEYVHIGLKYGLDNLLQKYSGDIPNEICLNFNIDGIPLSKSSSSCFWPILSKTNISKKIIVVGVYHGYGQPSNFNNFLRPFVDELKSIMIQYQFRSKQIKIKIGAFICDTPARAHILGIKSHAAYSGCPRCCQEGEYHGRMTFPETNAQMRTNVSFRTRADENHHNQDTILEELDIDLVLQFVLDYMHLVLLGVTKKLLRMFTAGGIESLLPTKCIEEINKLLEEIRKTQPSDFQRRIQLLNQLHNYKATEFRTFLLYAGPFVLRNVISKQKYDHYMLLNVAISILCTPNVSDEKIEFARELINAFINGMKIIYGTHHLIFNVHALIHLPDDVKRFGPLDLISAFDFESYMYQIQKLLRKKNQPLSQIYNRIIEMNNVNFEELYNELEYPILKREVNGVFYEVVTEHFTINNASRNCWVMTEKKEIIKFNHAVKRDTQIQIFGNEVIGNKCDFYDYPVSSSSLNIYKTTFNEDQPKYWNLSSITMKLFCMEKKPSDNLCFYDSDDEDEEYYNDNLPCRVFFPILHSQK